MKQQMGVGGMGLKPVTAHPAFPYFLLNLGYQFINLVVSIFIGS